MDNLATLVAENGCNIQSLQSFLQPAPEAGYDNFCASATLRVPANYSSAKLKADLEALGDQLGVEMTVEDADRQEGVDYHD